jgi:hypothetical protein
VPVVATLCTKGLIEIVLPGGTSVRVDAHVGYRALRCARCPARAMKTPRSGVQAYLACGYTDMRKGMATLAMLV